MNARMTVADVLDAAADLLTPEGAWMQGDLSRSYDGEPVCMCMLGAVLNTVAPAAWEAAGFLDEYLPKTRQGGLRPIAAWNDASDRTQAEVIAKLREAAAFARATASLTQGDGHGG